MWKLGLSPRYSFSGNICYEISVFCLCSAVPDLYAQCMHQFLMRMLSAHISFLRVCSVHASVPYGYAEDIENEHLKIGKTDAYAEHARRELKCMIRVRISS